MTTPAIQISNFAYKEAGLNYKPTRAHRHADYQWYCVLYGKVIMNIEGTDHTLGPKDSILIEPGASRAPRYGGHSPGYLYVLFQNHTLDLTGLPGKVVHVSEELLPDLNALVREMHEPPGVNSDQLMQAISIRMLIALGRASAASSQKGSVLNSKYQHEVVARADAYMLMNLHLKLTCEDIASATHVSTSRLSKVFRQTTGKSVLDRLTELRIERAKELLLESSTPITRIAVDVGYNSFSHFSAVFKSVLGVRPSDYRRSSGLTWRD